MNFNNKVPKWLIRLGFFAGVLLMLASTTETVVLFKSMSTGWIAYMFAIVGFCIDVGKTVTFALFVYFIILALSKKQYNKFWTSLLFLIVYLFCLWISMVASQSLDINKSNEIQNKTIIKSDTYNMNKQTFESSQEDIKYYRKKIDTIGNSKQTRIEQAKTALLEQMEKAKANRWLTTPQGSPREGVDVIDKKIASLPSSIENDIAKEIKDIENKILALNNNLMTSKSNIDNMKNGNSIKTTDGLIAFAEWLNPDNPTQALARFTMFKNVFREILGVMLIMLYNYKFDSTQNRIRAEIQDELSKKRISKSTIVQSGLSKEHIEEFIKLKKKYPSKGYKPISKLMGIAENKAGEIQTYLVSKGILVKQGNTYKVG